MTFVNLGAVLSARHRLSVVGPDSSGVQLQQPLLERASILPECSAAVASTFSMCVDLIVHASAAISMWTAGPLSDLTLLLVPLISK